MKLFNIEINYNNKKNSQNHRYIVGTITNCQHEK